MRTGSSTLRWARSISAWPSAKLSGLGGSFSVAADGKSAEGDATKNPQQAIPLRLSLLRLRRTTSHTNKQAYPDLVRENYRQVFVADDQNRVWGSFDEGSNWVELTQNLPSLTSQVATIEVFSPDNTIRNTVLIAGGFGVFEMRRPAEGGTIWTPLSGGFPNALVQDLHYDYTDNVLVAGTLGRGAWTLTGFFRGGGGTGPVAARTVTVSQPGRNVTNIPLLDPPQVPPVASPTTAETP
jgi:hypothetical protein